MIAAEVRPRATTHTLVAALGLVAIAAYLFGLAWAIQNTTYDVWGAILIAPALVGASYAFVSWGARRTGDTRILRLLPVILALKLFGTVTYALVISQTYGSVSDATLYDRVGEQLAESFRQFDFSVELGRRGLIGTGFIRALTGLVYTVLGSSKYAGFLLFSWFGFCGSYLLYRAFCTAVPEGNARNYALAVFFLPSMVFWPSAIGKEAWMVLSLGVLAYGAARLLSHRRFAYPLLGAGLVATGIVRPHVSAMVFVGLLVAYVVTRSTGGSRRRVGAKVVGVGVLLVAGAFLIGQVQGFLEIDSLDPAAINQELDRTSQRTVDSEGGSNFAPDRPRTPLDFPLAFVSVVLRPFPTDAHNPQAWISSLETTLVAGVLLLSLRRLLRLPAQGLRWPYLLMSATFVALFVYSFSSIANFGLLARERTQLWPFLFALVAAPTSALAPAAVAGSAPPVATGGRRLGLDGDEDGDLVPAPVPALAASKPHAGLAVMGAAVAAFAVAVWLLPSDGDDLSIGTTNAPTTTQPGRDGTAYSPISIPVFPGVTEEVEAGAAQRPQGQRWGRPGRGGSGAHRAEAERLKAERRALREQQEGLNATPPPGAAMTVPPTSSTPTTSTPITSTPTTSTPTTTTAPTTTTTTAPTTSTTTTAPTTTTTTAVPSTPPT